jgi:hypothetical protein
LEVPSGLRNESNKSRFLHDTINTTILIEKP